MSINWAQTFINSPNACVLRWQDDGVISEQKGFGIVRFFSRVFFGKESSYYLPKIVQAIRQTIPSLSDEHTEKVFQCITVCRGKFYQRTRRTQEERTDFVYQTVFQTPCLSEVRGGPSLNTPVLSRALHEDLSQVLDFARHEDDKALVARYIGWIFKVCFLKRGAVAGTDRLFEMGKALLLERGFSLAEVYDVCKGPELDQNIARMQQLLVMLQEEMKEDMSNVPSTEFAKKIDHQFDLYVEMVTLRSELKCFAPYDVRIAACNDAYKEFTAQSLPFHVPSKIKGALRAYHRASEADAPIPKEISDILSSFLPKESLERFTSSWLQRVQSQRGDGSRIEWKKEWRAVQKQLFEVAQRARSCAGESLLSVAQALLLDVPHGGDSIRQENDKTIAVQSIGRLLKGCLSKRGTVAGMDRLFERGMAVLLEKGVSLAEVYDVCKGPELDQNIARMQQLLVMLQEEMKGDMSNVPSAEFAKKTDHQFDLYVEMVTLRSELKCFAPYDARIAACNDAHKVFLVETPPFHVAAKIKRALRVHFKDFQPGDPIPIEIYLILSAFLLGDSKWRLTSSWLKRIQSQRGDASRMEWKKEWRAVQKQLFEGAQHARSFARDPNLKNKKIRWLTGTQSPTLVSMARAPVKEIGGAALIPTGELLRYGIVPLTGALDPGVRLSGVNMAQLSGVGLMGATGAVSYALHRADSAAGIFNPKEEVEAVEAYCSGCWYNDYPRIKIAVLRLLLARESGMCVDKDIARVREKIEEIRTSWSNQWEFASGLIGQVVPSPSLKGEVCEGAIVGSRAGAGKVHLLRAQRWFMIGDNLECLCSNGKAHGGYRPSELVGFSDTALRQLCKKRGIPEGSRGPKEEGSYTPPGRMAQELIDMLDGKIPTRSFKMTVEDQALSERSVGLVFGSFTITHLKSNILTEDGKERKVNPETDGSEILAVGPQRLGKDIQAVFVAGDRIDEVRAYIAKNLPTEEKIHVVGLAAITYLAADHAMTLHEQK